MVVDDEPLASRRLSRRLREVGVEVVAVFDSGEALLEQLETLTFDVAFLDIEMPPPNGLETAAQLRRRRDVAIVFVTAHDEHALAAFEVGALDYVLKPVKPERLAQTLARLPAAAPAAEELEAASRRLHPTDDPPAESSFESSRLEVRNAGSVRFYDPSEVQRLTAADKYVVFTAPDGTQQVLDESLTQLENRLRGHGFLRVHRRELVRVDAVRAVLSEAGKTHAELANGERADVSRRLVKALRARLESR